jgi:hypothetical protein
LVCRVQDGDFRVYKRGLACDSFEHGIGTEGIEIGTGVGEGEFRGNAL